MSNTSKKTFKELSTPYITEVYSIIDQICTANNVSCYLIGAQARDINLLESGIQPMRGTMDIDFAIMLPDMIIYEKILEDLVNSGFRKTHMPYRIIYDKTNTVIDLLPFGEVEEKGTVKFTDREVELSVVGFREVSSIAQEIIIGTIPMRVTPMEGLFILKLISWNEKPSDRAKDLDDLQFILKNYFVLNESRFYSDHLDCLDEIDGSNFQLIAGARLLGRDMAIALNLSDPLRGHILQILKEKLSGRIGWLTEYSSDFSDDHDELDAQLISHIVIGIDERMS
jgi:predicted nucleotidyltransferase